MIRHAATTTGYKGERFLAKLLKAEATQRNASHDLIVRGNRRLEVKCSKCLLNTPDVNDSAYRRWAWTRLLGQKNYHRLILLGERDLSVSRTSYRDPNSPFVIFDLSRQFVSSLVRNPKVKIQLSMETNSEKADAPHRKKIWKYEVTREEMRSRYGKRRK